MMLGERGLRITEWRFGRVKASARVTSQTLVPGYLWPWRLTIAHTVEGMHQRRLLGTTTRSETYPRASPKHRREAQ